MKSIIKINLNGGYEESKNETEPVIHTVVKNQFLSTIAKKYDTTVEQLQKDNNIENIHSIREGQKLTVSTKPKKKKKGDKVTFELLNSANLGDEVYVVVKTDNLQGKKVRLNVKQGRFYFKLQ